jgi:hypothetical protein
VVVVLLVEPVTPPVEPLVLGLVLGLVLELEPVLPLLGPPIELVLPLVLGGEPVLAVESVLLLPLVLGVVPAVLLEPVPLVEGVVVLEELVEPGAPAEPVVASRLLQALSERAATTARVAAAHCVRDVFIRNS